MNELTVSPQVNKGVKYNQNFAKTIIITSPQDAIVASDQILAISKLKDTLEGQRLEFTKPLNESLKKINAFFKQFTKPLDEADDLIRQKIVEFKTKNEEALKDINTFGVLHFTTYQSIEVVDLKKVPREYLTVDLVKVKKAIAEGKKIAGIKVNEEKRTSL